MQISGAIGIQARMSSRRFPGKSMAPICGKPMIQHVIDRCFLSKEIKIVFLLTSTDASDDVLADFVQRQTQAAVQRGNLNDVFSRYWDLVRHQNLDFVVRICGDSPLISPSLIDECISCFSNEIDLVTNVFPRSFPNGQSVEIINRAALEKMSILTLTDEEKEHVTKFIYNNRCDFNIRSIFPKVKLCKQDSFVIDSVEDYYRVESYIKEGKNTDFGCL